MDDDAYNSEDNTQAPLFGSSTESSRALRNHHNPWIRMPTRSILYVEETTHIASFIIAIWHGVPQSVSAIGEVLWQGIIASPAVLWRNRWLMLLFGVIVTAGVLLVIQGSRGEFNIFLMLFFAWGMVFLAIISRLGKRRNEVQGIP